MAKKKYTDYEFRTVAEAADRIRSLARAQNKEAFKLVRDFIKLIKKYDDYAAYALEKDTNWLDKDESGYRSLISYVERAAESTLKSMEFFNENGYN